MTDPFQLTGRSQTHVVAVDDGRPHRMHPDAITAFKRMREAAAASGIEIALVSAFRDFDRQAAIWNAKWKGERPLHDTQGELVNHDSLSPDQLAHTILGWSALPGASRHHWGSDIDVIDAAACPENYQVQLSPSEFQPGGHFHHLHEWLGQNMGRFGFFFPYKRYQGGVSVEPWHLSYAPVSVPALPSLSIEVLRNALAQSQVLGRDFLLERLDDIYHRYVLNIDECAPDSSRP